MSFFYLSPVKGDMPIHLLEQIVITRLQYLKGVLNGETIGYNEFLVEGSVYDNVGHFMLCIAAILSENNELSQLIMKAEIELFRRRLAALTSYDIRCFAKKLIRNIKKYNQVLEYIHPLHMLSQHLMLKDMAQHICSSSHTIECSIHCIQLGFRYCLHFISKRLVEIKNGIAFLPCGRWKQYLILMFNMNLKNRVYNTDLSPLKNDPRIKELLTKIQNEITITGNRENTNKLRSKDVDSASAYFPPCMANLHHYLRYKHRLSHSQRFYYSLFLKDIGMPMDEAVEFWRIEYRQSPNGAHSCCHNWEKDEKKYIYGIRHMYGLEGGRKNYSSLNCKRIQELDVSYSEGGCPFKSFDAENMTNALNVISEDPMLSHINELKARNQYTPACLYYLKTKYNIVCDNSYSFNFTPVKFFKKCTENVII